MSTSEDGHPKGLIDPHDIELLREDLGNIEAFDRIHMACRQWVRGRGWNLSQEDCQDIVSQAIQENLDALRFNVIPAEEVSEILKRSLNKFRARMLRQFNRLVEYQAYDDFENAVDEFNQLDLEGKIDKERARKEEKQRLLATIFLLRKHMRKAVNMLSPRDYAIIYSEYKLHALRSFKSPAVSLEGLSASILKVAAFRARQRFLARFEELLLEAPGEDPVAVEDALKLIRSKDFKEALNALNGNRE